MQEKNKLPFFWTTLLSIVLLGVLAWLFWTQEQAKKAAIQEQEARTASLHKANDDYEAYLQQLRNLLNEEPCIIEKKLAGLVPPAGKDLPLLPAIEQAKEEKPTQQEKKKPTTSSATAQIFEQSTVLIAALSNQNVSVGTGFFITKDTILTTAHVVGSAQQVVVLNKYLVRVQPATVFLRVNEKGLDFALLKTQQVLPITPLILNAGKLKSSDKVRVCGFTSVSSKFSALLAGRMESTPEVVITEGSVKEVAQSIVHSAKLSQESSGGPLINEKGEVVGINTQTRTKDTASLALPAATIISFLKANKIDFEECSQ